MSISGSPYLFSRLTVICHLRKHVRGWLRVYECRSQAFLVSLLVSGVYAVARELCKRNTASSGPKSGVGDSPMFI